MLRCGNAARQVLAGPILPDFLSHHIIRQRIEMLMRNGVRSQRKEKIPSSCIAHYG
jgi:hypothetical protein